MIHARAVGTTVHYAVAIESGGHSMFADESLSNGGADSGPSPYAFLLASLAACTAITLRMYADRKQWDLTSVTIDLTFTRRAKAEHIERTLRLEGNLSDEQRARLADIAERTPVTLTLKQGLSILTTLDPPLAADRAAEIDKRLDEALEESFPASDPPAVDP